MNLEQNEKIEIINFWDIIDFEKHPFKVVKDDSLIELMKSIKENGLINPLIVRKRKTLDNKYELISGHRRKRALEMLDINEAPCIIKDLSDDEATILMVDSNLHREKILPSEKAFAYKMRMDAIKHQGKSTCGPEGHKSKSRDMIAEISPDGARQIQRYIRLTYLIPELLNLVDNTVLYDKRYYITMGIKPAVELSYLEKTDQKFIYDTIEYNEITPNHAQTIKIRKLAEKGKLTINKIDEIFGEKKGNQNEQISFNKEKIVNSLPMNLIKRDKRYIEAYVIEAIEYYKKNHKKEDDFDNLYIICRDKTK